MHGDANLPKKIENKAMGALIFGSFVFVTVQTRFGARGKRKLHVNAKPYEAEEGPGQPMEEE